MARRRRTAVREKQRTSARELGWSRVLLLVASIAIVGLAGGFAISACAGNVSTTTSTAAQTTQPPTTSITAAQTTTLSSSAPTTTTSTSVPITMTSTTAASGTGNVQLIAQTLKLAGQGKVAGIPFAANTSGIDEVQAAWGPPSSQTSAGAGMYATYPAKYADFGFNKGDQVFDVRCYSPQLQAITYSQVRKVLGDPGIVRHTSSQTILLYATGVDFQLLWIFPAPGSSQPDPHLDHISVFYPRGTVNLMAQNLPNPSILVKQAPGTGGSLFTFAILNQPGGYALSELEWVPSSGQPVVNTLPQVSTHGTSGGTPPCFRVSADGKIWSFAYTLAMKSHPGVVKLIYQNTNGAAIIGQSDPITLK